eukprot:11178-Heterococcus_DN1.PRE.5
MYHAIRTAVQQTREPELKHYRGYAVIDRATVIAWMASARCTLRVSSVAQYSQHEGISTTQVVVARATCCMEPERALRHFDKLCCHPDAV